MRHSFELQVLNNFANCNKKIIVLKYCYESLKYKKIPTTMENI